MQIQDLLYHTSNFIRALEIKALGRFIALQHLDQAASVQRVLAREDIELITDNHLPAQETILGRVDESVRVTLLFLRLLQLLDFLAL